MSTTKGEVARLAVLIVFITFLLAVFVPGAMQAQERGYPTWTPYNMDGDVWGYYGHGFNSTYYTVYMKGEGFTPGENAYKVAYYDANGELQGVDSGLTVGEDKILESQYDFTLHPDAEPGVWAAIVYDITVTPPVQKKEEDFYVDASAIPEFPTVIAGIAVAGMCAGIYWWMRRRVYRVHRVYRVC